MSRRTREEYDLEIRSAYEKLPALDRLARAYRSFTLTPPVDDDFPEVLGRLDDEIGRCTRGVAVKQLSELGHTFARALAEARKYTPANDEFRPKWDAVYPIFELVTAELGWPEGPRSPPPLPE